MTATPRLLKSGRYQGITYDPITKKAGPTKVFDREYEAHDWARAWEQDRTRSARTHGIEFTTRTSSTTFADYVKTWNRGGPISTRQTYRGAANAFAKAWPTQRVDEITTAMVKAALLDMEAAGLSASTRTLRLTVARHIFADAITDGLRDTNPTDGVRAPGAYHSAGRHRPVTDEELDRIMAHLPLWMHAAVLLARDSGLRVSEVAGLRWFRLDLLHKEVVVADVMLPDGSFRDTPKGKIPAAVPLTARTVAALERHRELYGGTSTDRVFRYTVGSTTRMRAARPRVIRHAWNEALDAADIEFPRPRFHDLRHTRGHTLAKAGVPIQGIQAVLRHRSITMTRVYMGEVTVDEQARYLAMADEPRALMAV